MSRCFVFGLLVIGFLAGCSVAQWIPDYWSILPPEYYSNTGNKDPYPSCATTQSTGSLRDGVCMVGTECFFNRGKPQGRGTCNFWNSCCVHERTCNQTTNARISYFTRSSTQTRPTTSSICQMTVQLANEYIEQLRVDIISMSLSPPDVVTTGSTYSVACTNDRFYVDSTQTDVKIPAICGKNTNQHFYVHLTQRETRAVTFNVLLTNNPSLDQNPSWEIKITQLEGPARYKLLGFVGKQNPNQAVLDFTSLAPAGCLQYFTDPTGYVSSFGWLSDTDASLVTDQDYAICFERSTGSCGVTLTSTGSTIDMGTTGTCDGSYILIPEEVSTVDAGATAIQTTVCEDSPAGTSYISNHPGPLYVHVHVSPSLTIAAGSTAPTSPPAGFYMLYNTNTLCNT